MLFLLQFLRGDDDTTHSFVNTLRLCNCSQFEQIFHVLKPATFSDAVVLCFVVAGKITMKNSERASKQASELKKKKQLIRSIKGKIMV